MAIIRNSNTGFTLAELLIALMILGEIATFTIPKIIIAQQNQTFNARTKEDIASMSAIYQQYITRNGASSSLSLSSLNSYLNYTSLASSGLIDAVPGSTSLDCSAWKCYRLANGSTLAFDSGQTFGATDSLAVSYFYIDPDSTYSGTTNGTGKSIAVFLYYGGRVTTWGNVASGSHDVWGATYTPTPANDPTWFQW